MTLRTLPILALLLAFAVPAQAGPHRPNAKSLAWQMEELLRAAGDELAAIDGLVEAADRPAVRHELHRKTAELDGLLLEIRRVTGELVALAAEPVVVLQDRPVVIERPRSHPPMPMACEPGDFDRVKSAVQSEAFADDQLRVLRSALPGRYFNVEQVKEMMGVFSFGEQKVESAALMRDRIVDPQNWYLVYAALSFDSEKDELRRRVGD